MPDISVVIPTRDHSGLLERTLASLSRQRFPRGRYEVVAVDDGSTDETPGVLRRWARRLPLRSLRQPGRGPAAARNRGVLAARAGLILFLDDDCLAAPELLGEHRRGRRAAGGGVLQGWTRSGLAAWSAGAVASFGGRRGEAAGASPRWLYTPEDVARGRARPLPVRARVGVSENAVRAFSPGLKGLETSWMLLSTRNVSVPKALLLEAGLFDEGFRTSSYEAKELGLRLHRRGARFAMQERPLCWHQVTGTDPARLAAAMAEAYRLFCSKHPVMEVFLARHYEVGRWGLGDLDRAVGAFRRLLARDPVRAQRLYLRERRSAERFAAGPGAFRRFFGAR